MKNSVFQILGASAALLFVASIAWAGGGDVPVSAKDASPLKIGASVPKVSVTTLAGKSATFQSILGGKPSVVIFYRGGWCPYCNTHLAELAKIESEVRARGYQIVAISPDTPDELAKTVTKEKLAYQLFSDSKADAMKAFGVAFRVEDATYELYRDQYKLDLEKKSGQKHHILPVPAVFVINKAGLVTFSYSNPDYKVRLKGADLLAALGSK